MKNNPEDFWTEKYEQKRTEWDLGEVSPPLKSYIDQLTKKDLKILIPGAGNAYEAEYLVKNGFTNVTVIDIARQPLQNLKSRIPDFPSEKLLHQDFFELENTFDLILEQTFFCALPPVKRSDYAQKMNSLLKPSGKLVGVLFNRKFYKEGPPFGGNIAEFRELFQEYFEILEMENCYNSVEPRKGSELFFIFKKLN